MPKIITREQWEQRVNEDGAGRYEFVRWAVEGNYRSRDKCVVRCVDDGFEWSARVGGLVNGRNGCPQCAGKRRWTSEERIKQINELENIEFISFDGDYKNCYSKANVKCSVDNFEWSARVSDLVNTGFGCPQCANQRRWTADERIEQINKLENIEFVCWVDSYKNAHSKAMVRCLIDGFMWNASVHKLVNCGRGCPSCAKYGYDQSKTGTIYALRSECGKYVKVGISNNPSQRHKQLELATPFIFSCIEQFEGDGTKIAELEKYFHSKYERAGLSGFDGATEWLICTDELLNELRTIKV